MLKCIITISKSHSCTLNDADYNESVDKVLKCFPNGGKTINTGSSNNDLVCYYFDFKSRSIKFLSSELLRSCSSSTCKDLFVKGLILDIKGRVVRDIAVITFSNSKALHLTGMSCVSLTKELQQEGGNYIGQVLSWLSLSLEKHVTDELVGSLKSFLVATELSKEDLYEYSLIKDIIEGIKQGSSIVSRIDLIGWHKRGLLLSIASNKDFYILKTLTFKNGATIEVYVE